MELTFNSREKEILVDVLEAQLETLEGLVVNIDAEFKEERDAVKVLLNKVQEA